MLSTWHAALTWLGSMGAGLLLIPLSLGALVAATGAGYYAERVSKKKWIGWIVGIVAFVLIALIFGPSILAIKRVSCHGASDYSACMDGDDDN